MIRSQVESSQCGCECTQDARLYSEVMWGARGHNLLAVCAPGPHYCNTYATDVLLTCSSPADRAQFIALLLLLDKNNNAFGLCKWKLYLLKVGGKWGWLPSGHSRRMRRRILTPGLNWGTESCPLVIRSPRTHINSRSQQGPLSLANWLCNMKFSAWSKNNFPITDSFRFSIPWTTNG